MVRLRIFDPTVPAMIGPLGSPLVERLLADRTSRRGRLTRSRGPILKARPADPWGLHRRVVVIDPSWELASIHLIPNCGKF